MLEGTCHCGRSGWTLAAMPTSVTACSCTICRRYGALWAYGHLDDDVHVSGPSSSYRHGPGQLEFHFCPYCGSAMYNKAVEAAEDGRHWIAVNLRMTDPALIADLPVDHFDGLDSWSDLPPDGLTVKDMWF